MAQGYTIAPFVIAPEPKVVHSLTLAVEAPPPPEPPPTAWVAATLSMVPTFDTRVVTFTSDSDIDEWKVEVVADPDDAHDAGVVIPDDDGSLNVTGGALAAGTPVEVTLKYADIAAASPGAGSKVIKVFVHGAEGWSV